MGDVFSGWLVVGLGNPEDEYAGTRHNVGFEVIDRLAVRWNPPAWSSRFHGRFTTANPRMSPGPVLLLKPMTYMNLSGKSAQGVMAFYRVHPERVLVIHDDLDLELGTLRLKAGGGTAGHRGLASLCGAVGAGFLRLRVGIGRPQPGGTVDHVLSPFSPDEQRVIDDLLPTAVEIVETVLEKGAQAAMNAFHGRRRKKAEPPPDAPATP